MNDPLAQFRRKPPAAAGTARATGQTPPPKSPDGYAAFDTKDRVARLKIFRTTRRTRRAITTCWTWFIAARM